MDRLAERSFSAYQDLVYGQDRVFQVFLRATPIHELPRVHFGSRPAYREGKFGNIEALRFIPWVFGWTQIRLNLPAWFGVGAALSSVAEEQGGLEALQEMSSQWCFFSDLLGKIEMVCAKTDMDLLNRALGATLNGIAQGLRNTG